MATLRARLTVAYGVRARRQRDGLLPSRCTSAQRRERQLRRLGRVAVDAGRPRARASFALRRVNAHPLIEDAVRRRRRRPAACARSPRASRTMLEPLPGYFILFDRDDRQLYTSIGLRQLRHEDRSAIDSRGGCSMRARRTGRARAVSRSDMFDGEHAPRRAPRLDAASRSSRASSPACRPTSPSSRRAARRDDARRACRSSSRVDRRRVLHRRQRARADRAN